MSMPYKGDEFHHFGWNACSSALSPLTGHAFLGDAPEVLIGLRNGREIMLRLVGMAPSNTQWKKDLAWFDDQIARLKGQAQEAG
jgi:selenium-binding protein 1